MKNSPTLGQVRHVVLFYLLITTGYTNEILLMIDQENRAIDENFFAYMGLELATSLVPLKQLRFYWSNDMFCGYEDFNKVMARNRSQFIRSSLT